MGMGIKCQAIESHNPSTPQYNPSAAVSTSCWGSFRGDAERPYTLRPEVRALGHRMGQLKIDSVKSWGYNLVRH